MMAQFEGIHPDEGTIHAWLDDALDAPSAARVEAHVAACAECAERVAEARGLIAGASRVVGLLDEAPRPLIRPAASPTNGTDLSARRWFRVTPMRSAIAALLIVAVGLTLTRERIAVDSTAPMTDKRVMVMSEPAASPPAAGPIPEIANDSVLASAVSKRLEQDRPARGVSAAPGVAIPQAPPAPAANVPTINTAPAREVATGRAMAQLNEVVSSAASADKASAKLAAPQVAGAGCYRITSADTAATTWGGLVLPAEIALASTNAPPEGTDPRYAITPLAGGNAIGTWGRLPGDALTLTLRGVTATTVGTLTPERARFTGSLAILGAPRAVAAAPAASGAAGAAESRTLRARSDMMVGPMTTGRSVRVVATRIDCP